MNIWIDLGHIPQHNFYRQFIKILSEEGHRVFVTVLGRGRLPKIVQHDLAGLPNVTIEIIGRHRMKKWSAIMEVNLIRIPHLYFWSLGKHIDVALSNHHQTSIIARLLRIPGYAFGDDTQTTLYPVFVRFATQSHSLIYEENENSHILPKDTVLPCLKEWSYLAPKYFEPHIEALDKYGVNPKEYVFLREVSVGTVNYAGQERGAIRNIQHLIPKNKKVLFSLEEKNRRGEYPEDWILLQEPIEDIHSLIYYSAGLVSSGDSMAREAALLGVPSYYLGVRHSMPANAAASKVANLQNELTMPFDEWVKTLECNPKEAEQKQQELRKYIDSKFIDINEYMLSLVHKVEQEKKNKN